MNSFKYYSQNREDIFLYRNFLNKKVNDGIYVELGAMNGVTYSNTLFLENNLGYKGLLIEPNNKQYTELKKNRSNNFNENYAVDTLETTKTFIGTNACGGLVETMAKSHKETWHKNKSEYLVKTIPINKLLKKHNISYIDFFSIDVEGGELRVLETMDWSIPVYLICIELDNQNIEKDDKCRKILNENNFKFLVRINNNDWYINEKYFRKDLLYDKEKGSITKKTPTSEVYKGKWWKKDIPQIEIIENNF
jgi:FkbM family methyltransferase